MRAGDGAVEQLSEGLREQHGAEHEGQQWGVWMGVSGPGW